MHEVSSPIPALLSDEAYRARVAELSEDNGRVPCSRYGRSSEDCAPVAVVVDAIVSAETGEDSTRESRESVMGMAVNDSEDLSYTLARFASEYGVSLATVSSIVGEDSLAEALERVEREALDAGVESSSSRLEHSLATLERVLPRAEAMREASASMERERDRIALAQRSRALERDALHAMLSAIPTMLARMELELERDREDSDSPALEREAFSIDAVARRAQRMDALEDSYRERIALSAERELERERLS